MKIPSTLLALVVAASPFALPDAALARAMVVASTPAQGATVPKARVVTLTFSESLRPASAAASIVMTAMPGMANHGEMAIRNFTTAWSNDNRTMTLNLAKPLPKGTYEVRWQAAGEDGHRVSGKVSFFIG